MAGFQPINLTSLAFQWLLDIGLVEFKDGHGFRECDTIHAF